MRALGYATVRYAGGDRYETAIKIDEVGLGSPSSSVLATGINFPDALSGGAPAAAFGGAIVLTAGPTLPAVSRNYLNAHPGRRFALGGPAAAADPTATAIVGVDRYDTARKVADTFFSGPTSVAVASGVNFPDALAGGAHIARKPGPLLLTDPFSLSPATDQYVRANKSTIGVAFIYGGPAAVSDAVAAQVQADLSS